jgi:hypothetical protein
MSATAVGAGSGATHCAACGAPMVCGRNDPAGCWCARLPPLPAGSIEAGQSCLCERCLRTRQTGCGARADPHR